MIRYIDWNVFGLYDFNRFGMLALSLSRLNKNIERTIRMNDGVCWIHCTASIAQFTKFYFFHLYKESKYKYHKLQFVAHSLLFIPERTLQKLGRISELFTLDTLNGKLKMSTLDRKKRKTDFYSKRTVSMIFSVDLQQCN